MEAIIKEMYYLLGKEQILFKTFMYIPPKWDVVTNCFIWDLKTDSIKPVNWRTPIAISYDGRYLAYAGRGNEDGRIATVVDLQTGEEVAFVPAPQELPPNGIKHLSISPDNRYIGCTITYPGIPYGFQIWDIALKRFVYLLFFDVPVVFSPDGKYFAFGLSVWLYNFEKIKRKIEAALGVPEAQAKSDLFVHPHSLKDESSTLEYKLDKPMNTTITIFDNHGNKVLEEECGILLFKYGRWTIPIDRLSSGIYFVTIKNFNDFLERKFLILR